MASKFDAIPKDYRQHGVFAVKFGEKLPVLDVELNELQQNLSEKMAEEVRQNRHSGFLNINYPKGHIDSTGNFGLTDSAYKVDAVNINGHKIELAKYASSANPKSGYIKLPVLEAPTEGTRSDFYFLEAWFKEIKAGDPIYYYGNVDGDTVENLQFDARINMETTRRVQLQWRIRAIAGVDFDKFPEGFTKVTSGRGSTDYNLIVRPQGGNPVPLENDNSTAPQTKIFSNYQQRKSITGSIATEDIGLYVAGDGTSESKNTLQTTDGYVYAIPLFRVDRRNSGGYSVENPNGAINYVSAATKSDRPDGLFANIIAPRDITDLRHLVPTSVDYTKVLTEEFNKYMRGENGNKKMLKTYHGIRKTPIDSNTVFYASLDGTYSPELGDGEPEVSRSTELSFIPSPTGVMLGRIGTDVNEKLLSYPITPGKFTSKEATLDIILDTRSLQTDKYRTLVTLRLPEKTLFGIGTGNASNRLSLVLNGNNENTIYFNYGLPVGGELDKRIMANKYAHIRVTASNGTYRMYANGTLVATRTVDTYSDVVNNLNSVTELRVACAASVLGVCDISLSNIDRGTTYATLPKDFIDGYAVVGPAFIPQRRIQSDAQTSQVTADIVSPTATTPKHITKTQSVPGVWTKGDTIKISALGGGVIGGLIDVDTAKARILKDVNNSTTLLVDNVDGLAVNDSLRIYSPELTLLHSVVLKEIDPVTKLVTLATPVTVNAGGLLIEYTTSSSAPVVTANGLTGAWSSLGTKEALFTVNTPPTTNTEAIKIEYAVNYPAGQGALPEVLDTVLSAEAKGQKLVLGNQVLTDDFKSKIPDSTVANPHSFHRVSSADILAPTSGSWIEEGSSAYNEISKNNGVAYMHQTIISGERAEVKISFNLIRALEDKYGVGIFKGCKTTADKIQFIKDNIYTITANWYGYGSNGDGNKATLAYWHHTAASYASGTKSHTEATITRLTLIMSGTGINSIDDSGFIHLNVYAEPSNGTAPSQIFTDYIDLAITFKDKAGYDLLVPENPRRDGGEANILYIRKETNEVEVVAPADENSGLITYGKYTPPTHTLPEATSVTVLAEGDGFLISDLGTAVGHKQEAHHWLNPLYRVRNNPKDVFGEFGFANVPFSADTKGVNVGKLVTVDATGFKGAYTTQYGLTTIKKPLVGIARYLVLHEGELKLLVYSLYSTKGEMVVGSTEGKALLIPISGRPLVKEPKGTVQSAVVTPKPWKTSAGVIEGYLNDKGEVIATYQ